MFRVSIKSRAPPQAGLRNAHGLVSHSATIRSRRRSPGRSKADQVCPLVLVYAIRCPSDLHHINIPRHPLHYCGYNGCSPSDTLDTHDTRSHRSSKEPPANDSHPSPTICPAFVGRGMACVRFAVRHIHLHMCCLPCNV